MKRNLPVIVIWLLISSCKPTKTEEIDRYFSDMESRDAFSGFVMIQKDNDILVRKGYGYADRENRIRNSDTAQFQISSTGKLLTSALVLKLEENGSITLDDPINNYIDSLPRLANITIAHLLTHSDGLKDFESIDGFTYNRVNSCGDIVPHFAKMEPSFNPGDSGLYTNSGMMLLGAMLENILNADYQSVLQQELLTPLGMFHSSFANYSSPEYLFDNQGNYAKGYEKNDQGEIVTVIKPNDNFVPLAAGGMWSSAKDLITFHGKIYNGEFLKKTTIDLLMQPRVFSGWPDCYFGYGWMMINKNSTMEAIGHAGNTTGHHNTFFHYPEHNTTILILSNFGFVDIFKISADVEEIMFG